MPPPSAAQVYTPPPAPRRPPRLDRLDERLLEVVRQEGVIPLWSLLNLVAGEETNDRATAREMRMGLWQRVRRLVWLRLLWWHRRRMLGIKPPPAVPSASRRRSTATVRRTSGMKAVSTHVEQTEAHKEDRSEQVGNQVTPANIVTSGEATGDSQTKTAHIHNETANRVHHRIKELMRPHVISASARALAFLPRRPRRRWTGWLSEDCRGYRDMSVLLPSGQTAYLFGAVRRRAVVTLDAGRLLGGWGDGPFRWALLPAAEVRPLKNPHAVVLGQAKRGIRERSSEAKLKSCRRNGRRPCRFGRRRGRPRRR
jgi:hypothetical protein